MKLTSREKFLLAFLAFLVINVVGYVVIYKPLVQEQQTVISEQDILQEEYIQEKIMAESLYSLKSKDEELTSQLKDVRDQFLQPEQPELKDQFLYDLLEGSVKTWRSLVISDVNLATLPQSEAPLSSILMVEANFNINGSLADMIEVVDKIQQLPQIISFSTISLTQSENSYEGTFTAQFYTLSE